MSLDASAFLPKMTDEDFGDLLRQAESSDPKDWNELMLLVYADLKRIAHGQMARVAPGQILSTTVLVHEAFEKLAAQGELPVRQRADFYALCAFAMHQIIIDHYRRRSADKRMPDHGALSHHDLLKVLLAGKANPQRLDKSPLSALGYRAGQIRRARERASAPGA